MSPYSAYHTSDVEWLGDVPEHWEVGNIRRYAEMKSGHTPSRQHPEYWDDCDIPWFTLADVWQLRDGRATFLGKTRELISHFGIANSAAELLPAGTVILSRTASVGFSGIMPVPMATSQDFWNWVCGPKLTPKYLLLCFRSMHSEFKRLMMGSTHRTIYEASAASFCIPVPPIQEQQAIVGFLEERLPSNDAAVDAATRAIERLQEYRTALITRTVTRGLPPDAARAAGLDPSPRLKPSGVEWLSDIPEHWEVIQPSFGFARIGSGTTPQSHSYEYYDGDTPWVTTTELRETTIVETAKSVTAA